MKIVFIVEIQIHGKMVFLLKEGIGICILICIVRSLLLFFFHMNKLAASYIITHVTFLMRMKTNIKACCSNEGMQNIHHCRAQVSNSRATKRAFRKIYMYRHCEAPRNALLMFDIICSPVLALLK